MQRLTVLLISSFLMACSTSVSLFPISGPYAQAKQIQPIIAKADGIMGNSGKISLTLPSGEACNGMWSSVAPTSASANVGMGSIALSSNMANAWGTAYGTSFSIGNSATVNRGEAMLICDKGISIQIEFFTGSGTANGYGVAKDSSGNIYKVLM
jgi:hypothetical protein